MEEGTGGKDREERIHNAITLAKNMRNNGASLEAIEFRMANRGLDSMAIKAVMQHVPVEEPKNIIVSQDTQSGGRMILVVVGLAFLGLGAFLVVGNRTGLAPSLPFMGFFLMVIGGAIMAAGRF